MRKLLHIGMPKSASTYIQRNLLCQCPDVYHVGVARPQDDIGYVSREMGSLIEHDVLRAREEYFWNGAHNKGHELFQRVACHAADSGFSWLSLSEEHFGMVLDPSRPSRREVFRRLRFLSEGFDDVLIVWREPLELLDSWYKESIRLGLSKTSEQYYQWVWQSRFTGFLVDLDLRLLTEDVETIFNVTPKIVDFDEQVRGGGLSKLLGEWMKVVFPVGGRSNDQLSEHSLLRKRELNKGIRHDLGGDHYSHFQWHRLRDWIQLTGSSNDTMEDEIFGDVRLKRGMIQEAESGGGEENFDPLIEMGPFRKLVAEFLKA